MVGGLSPATAAGLSEAESFYAQGEMAAAASLARSLDSAEGFALAAKATLVEAAYLSPEAGKRASPEAGKRALFEHAAADAKAALALDPNRVDALLQRAIALGQLAELGDPISAHVNGYAKEGKALIDRALALDPGNEWARAVLGVWHIEIVHHAGDALAERLYGASRETGLELCSKTMAGAHAALALKYGCALALVELDADAFAHTAKQTLATIIKAKAEDTADSLVQSEAARLLARLKSADSR